LAGQVKDRKGGANISSKLISNKDVAATAVTGADIEMNAMPRNNSVDLATGQPLAAMAATAMEVSVDALLSGPGRPLAVARRFSTSPHSMLLTHGRVTGPTSSCGCFA